MKKLFLLLAVVAISHSIGFSQGCLPEGITFYDQEDIDNFQFDYPGCTEIEGDVKIGGYPGNSSINNLNGLNVLAVIDGNCLIEDTENLLNLNGLDNLTHIGGDLSIKNNILTSLNGLFNLTSVDGALRISVNMDLTSLSGLDNLNSIGGYLWINGNNALPNLSGLDNLISIGGDLLIENLNLSSLNGLDNLSSIGATCRLVVHFLVILFFQV